MFLTSNVRGSGQVCSSGSGRHDIKRRRNTGLAFALQDRFQNHCINVTRDSLQPEQVERVMCSHSFSFHGSFFGRVIYHLGMFSLVGISVSLGCY